MRIFTYTNRSPVWNKPFILEQWRPIDDNSIQGADGTKFISTFGRVFDTLTNDFVTPSRRLRNKSNKYDLFISIKTIIDGIVDYKYMAISRVLMIVFYPVPNMENLEVNHIDGDTENNCIYNLCWCTHAENVRFAFLNGQITYQNSDEIRYLVHSNFELDQICKRIIEGKTYNEIAEEFGILYQVPYMIHRGQIYKEYYDKYNLSSVPIPREREFFAEEELNQIGTMITQRIPLKVIADTMECAASTISDINNGRLYPEIYNKYELWKYQTRNTTRLTKDEKRKLASFVNRNKDSYSSINDLYRDALRYVGMEVPDKIDAKTRQFVYYTCNKY